MRRLLRSLRAIWRRLTGRTEPEADSAGNLPLPDRDGRRPARVHTESSEQYIERLLAAAGGRMRQQAIVAATDWSPATVSRHLSTMEAQEQIIRVTVGREKIVCLPTAAPEPVDAPNLDDSIRT